MIFYDQTTFSEGDAHGDCVRACVASLLGVDPVTLPHPINGSGDWNTEFHRILRKMGKTLRSVSYDPLYAPDCVIRDINWGNFVVPNILIAAGPTLRGGTLHAVIYDRRKEKMLHDPHPSRAGLKQIKAYDYIAPYPGPKYATQPAEGDKA